MSRVGKKCRNLHHDPVGQKYLKDVVVFLVLSLSEYNRRLDDGRALKTRARKEETKNVLISILSQTPCEVYSTSIAPLVSPTALGKAP
jgi:hypothetical protein